MNNNHTANVIITSNPNNNLFPAATVEAEYGSITIEGSVTTLAHHGANSDNPCPCLGAPLHLNLGRWDIVQVSHFDLDTLGGVARVMGWKDFSGVEDMFWKVAALVDVQGPHRLNQIRDSLAEEALSGFTPYEQECKDEDYFFSCEWEETVEMLHAFWAWSEKNRLFPPRDGNALDVTGFFERAWRVVTILLEGNDNDELRKELIGGGRTWAENNSSLNKTSFRGVGDAPGIGRVVLREAPSFVNHIYDTPDGEIVDAVLALNTKFGSITLSFEDGGDETRNACAIMQQVFGPEAGGHRGIAGSPRNVKYTFEDLEKVLW